MPTSTIHYEGDLRTTCTHLQSNTPITTDAPTDNHGKGEAFSPTDLLATSLVSCMITTMGIKAAQSNIPFKDADGEMMKIMANNPRRVAAVEVTIKMKKNGLTDDQIKYLEDIALNCPVAKSLHPDIKQEVRFEYY